MFRGKLSKVVLFTMALFILFGAGTAVGSFRANSITSNIDEENMAESAYDFSDISDLINKHSFIATVEVIDKGKPYGVGNGIVKFGNRVIDTNEYFAETKAKVLKVLKGDSNLTGETITVTEHIGSTPDTINDFVMAQSSQYLLFLNKDEQTNNNNAFCETIQNLTKYKVTDEEKVMSIKSSKGTNASHPLKDSLDGKTIGEIIDLIKSSK